MKVTRLKKINPKPKNPQTKKPQWIFFDFLVLFMIEVELKKLEALFVWECNFDIAVLFWEAVSGKLRKDF